MARLLFVGERPSPKAKAMGVSWADGRLAAKTLHHALESIGIRPSDHAFTNLFLPANGKERISRDSLRGIKSLYADGFIVIAMGKKVQQRLREEKIEYVPIVHPAARGKIRKRNRYVAHVRQKLGSL